MLRRDVLITAAIRALAIGNPREVLDIAPGVVSVSSREVLCDGLTKIETFSEQHIV